MKKLLSIVAIAAIMSSCNDSKTEETTVVNTDTISMDANNAKAMADSATAAMADTANKMMNNMTDTASKMMDKMADTAHKMMNHAADKMEKAGDKMEKAADKMMEKKP